MGAVKRVVYNEQLMLAVNYAEEKCIRNLLRNFDNLLIVCERGDQVASSIVIDLKTALGYFKEKSPLTTLQIQAIKLTLILGLSQEEVSEMMGVSQRTVSHHVNAGIKNICKYLGGE